MKCVAVLVAVTFCLAVEASVLPLARYGHHLGFYGVYPGHCAEKEGMYLNGPDSFVVCTNGNAYVQPCAPGSVNGPSQGYKVGSQYGQKDFCNINLNDHGYGVHQRYYQGYPGYYPGYAYGGFPYFW